MKLNFNMDQDVSKRQKMSDDKIVEAAWEEAEDYDHFGVDFNKPKETEEDAAMEEIATSERARIEDEIQEQRVHAYEPSSLIEEFPKETKELDLEEEMDEDNE